MELRINVEMIITIITSILASSGFWAWMMKRNDKKDLKTQMLLGLGHDRIIDLGLSYIKRKYITPDELENLVDYLYKPYELMGGNGTAKRIVEECKKLPMIYPEAEGEGEN